MLPYNWLIRTEYLYVKISSYTTFIRAPAMDLCCESTDELAATT